MSGSFNENKNTERPILKYGLWAALGIFIVLSISNVWFSIDREGQVKEATQAQHDKANDLTTPSEEDEGNVLIPDPTSTIANAATAALATQVSTLENQLKIQRDETEKLKAQLESGLQEISVEQKEIALKASQDMAQVVTLIKGQFDEEAQTDRETVIDPEGDLVFEESGGLIFENDGMTESESSTTHNTGTTTQSNPKQTTGYKMFRPSKPPANTAVNTDLLPKVKEAIEPEETTVTVTIPATSFADAETLYGVACPIVSNVVSGVSASNGGMRVPVVIPVRSTFKGPNGDIENIGTANILADCYGQRTSDSKIGRAVLELKRISFVDDNTEKHWETIEGIVVDKKTEAIYIEGPIDKARTSNIWTRALNAAVSTAAFGFSAQGVVLTKGDGQGGYEQSFSGDPIKDMAAQGVGGYFNDLQSGFAEMMNAAVDTVGVAGGRDIKVVLTDEVSFKIKVKKDEFYASQDSFLF